MPLLFRIAAFSFMSAFCRVSGKCSFNRPLYYIGFVCCLFLNIPFSYHNLKSKISKNRERYEKMDQSDLRTEKGNTV